MTTPTTPDRLTKAPADTAVFSHLAPGASTQPGHEGQDAVVITVHTAAQVARGTDPAAALILMVVPTAGYVEYTYTSPTQGAGEVMAGAAPTFITTPRSDELPPYLGRLLAAPAVQDAVAGALALQTPKEAPGDDVVVR